MGQASPIACPCRRAYNSRFQRWKGCFPDSPGFGRFLISLRGFRPSSFALRTSSTDSRHRRFASAQSASRFRVALVLCHPGTSESYGEKVFVPYPEPPITQVRLGLHRFLGLPGRRATARALGQFVLVMRVAATATTLRRPKRAPGKAGTRPPLVRRRRLPRLVTFGAQSHGLGTHCLRFAPAVARQPGRKTRFRLLARLCRAGLAAHKVPMKGFRHASYIAFPFPRLGLAQRTCNSLVDTQAERPDFSAIK